MAVLWIEGWDGAGTSNAEMQEYMYELYGHNVDTTFVGQSTTGRGGSGRAWRAPTISYFVKAFPNTVTFIIGFGFRASTWVNAKAIINFRDIDSDQCSLQTITGGEIRFLRGATTMATTSGLGGAVDTWYHIELKVTIDNTTGAYELKVDGVSEFSASGVDTQQGAAYVNNILCYPNPGAINYDYDDFYLLDDTGATNNDFLGDLEVVMLNPDGNGDTNDFTIYPDGGESAYQDVDDGTSHDSDSTYVESATATEKELYDFDTQACSTIAAVQIHTNARKTDAGIRGLKLLAKYSTTTSTGATIPLSVEYTNIVRVMETDPDGSAWTDMVLAATQFGFEVV